MSESAELLVLGGGPAGAAAAITAAQEGLSVILVEALAFPREAPGETLHPGAEALLRQLGVWPAVQAAQFHRHRGIWVCTSQGTVFQPYGQDDDGPWFGLQAERSKLDEILIRRAVEVGITLVHPGKVRQLDFCGGARVVTSVGEHACRWFIDAAGSAHWLSRRLGLPIRHASTSLFCSWRWIGERLDLDDDPRLTITSNGWTWGAWLGARTSIAELQLGSRSRPAGVRSRNVTWRRVEKVSGDGWMMAGDAAGVLDPLNGKGLLRALMSGMMCGWLVAQSVNGRVSPRSAQEEYERWFSSAFEGDLHQLAQAYAAYFEERSPALF